MRDIHTLSPTDGLDLSSTTGLDIDPVVAERNKAERHRRFNMVELPRIRAFGFALLAAATALHRALIPVTSHPRIGVPMLMVVLGAYSLLSWLAIRRWYRPASRLSIENIVLLLDPMPRPVGFAALARAVGRARRQSSQAMPAYLAGRRDVMPPLPWAGRRVLIAEDNVVNQRVAARFVEKLGCRVDVVANGFEAVDAAGRSPYDLILMDCQMPEMDGFAATAEIRRLETGRPRTPIVALTASALAGDRERCLASGMDDYLAKPVTATDVATVCSRWLPAPRGRTSDTGTKF